MNYIMCQEPGQIKLLQKDAPARKSGEALIKITRVGLCGTDYHAFAGRQPFFSYPRILGHELAGKIIEVGPNNQGFEVGDQVMVSPYFFCGKCIACRQGKTNCCTNLKLFGVHIDGGMQEYFSYPLSHLIKANGLSPEALAIVEPLAIGAHAISRVAVQPGEFVVVMGCGPIGVGIIAQAKIAGAKVIAFDINPDRLKYCQEKLGIEHTVLATDKPQQRIKEITNGDLATLVLDATGNKRAIEQGVEYLAHGGRYGIVGLYKGPLQFEHPYIHARELSLLCCRNAVQKDLNHVVTLLQEGLFPVNQYVTHLLPYQELPQRISQLGAPNSGVMKAITVWD